MFFFLLGQHFFVTVSTFELSLFNLIAHWSIF